MRGLSVVRQGVRTCRSSAGARIPDLAQILGLYPCWVFTGTEVNKGDREVPETQGFPGLSSWRDVIRSSKTHHFDALTARRGRRAPVGSDRAGCSRVVGGSRTHLFGTDTEHSPAGNPWGLQPLLDVGELAAYLGVPISTVYDWRTRGLGPRAYRFGKHLKFALSDVRTWIELQDLGSQV